MVSTIAAFSLYFAAVLLIGFLVSRFSSKDLDHFFLANRTLGGFVVALSTVASGRSAWLLLGFSGMAFSMGVAAVWATVGYISIEAILFLTVGKKLRRETGRMGDITIPDYFASRYPGHSQSLRLLSAVPIVVFLTAYVAAQLLAAGKAFQSAFTLPVNEGMVLAAAIILVYTLLGGFLAVALTDVIQGLLMILALIGLPLTVLVQRGGFSWLASSLMSLDPGLIAPMNLSVAVLAGFLGIGLGSAGNPHILVRYMAAREEKDLVRAAMYGTVANILMAVGATCTGLVGRAVYLSADHLPSGDPEMILPYLARDTFHPFLFGVVLAAIFAAIMSTCDSQLLVASSGLIRDIYQKILRKNRQVSTDDLVRLSRLAILILMVLAVLLAVSAKTIVFWFVLFSWSGLGAAIGPAVIVSLYSSNASGRAILAGMVVGAVVTVVWNQVPLLKSSMYELVPAFFLSLITILLISGRNGTNQVYAKPE
ncbi:MAG TPA: sodium/proline symporter [Thermoanaerobaculia bacterium]|nr:sodium/proline symporter [Thermoanaerobaculia bacterium]HUM29839.1 sodium/proline symporter [Thermoanaerobaculia bacterium]HXK68114.1 sodium/proline symporter [Thermoanaerobaculia bacterium]